jgi:hypothetical protein
LSNPRCGAPLLPNPRPHPQGSEQLRGAFFPDPRSGASGNFEGRASVGLMARLGQAPWPTGWPQLLTGRVFHGVTVTGHQGNVAVGPPQSHTRAEGPRVARRLPVSGTRLAGWSPAWPAVHTPQNKALTHRILGPLVRQPLFLIPSRVLYALGVQSWLIHRADWTAN